MKEKIYKLDERTEAHVYQSTDGPAVCITEGYTNAVYLHKTEAKKLVKLLNQFVNTKKVKNVVRKETK